jgi:hypothetical protein
VIGVGNYVVRGSEGGWELVHEGAVVASYRVHYRARVVRCDTTDHGTWWFLMSRGTRLVARRDSSLDDAARYDPRFRGGVITIGSVTYRLRPPGLRGQSWLVTRDVRPKRLRAPLLEITLDGPEGRVCVGADSGAEAALSLLTTVAVMAAVLERSEPRLRTPDRWST